ncbi:MAG: AmmeMemoRadiSam system radical SAM enzyme [Proteobacteria bacterium]|jgi:pyruvate formate lyase activating enzyme|nr:AmmeMemoRadiSam system radical SAM enzyme [Pseudomonadota bacterium]
MMGKYWEATADGRFRCVLCPRMCRMAPGQRGFCYVRAATDKGIVLDTYGRSSGFCIDPIEKKPLNHFLPGTAILSFGTAGCNLGCRFCQNWDISKARQHDRLMDRATPLQLATAARKTGCRSVAFTYNDPVVFAEYAIDTAVECRQVGVKTVAVTAGYITDRARGEFFSHMDAVNIDLKAFSEEFYKKQCYARLGDVLDTISFVVHETDCWLELTTLLIPGANDSDEELQAMTSWVRQELGPDVPMHFSAFHPDFKVMDRPRTPLATLLRARDIALQNGINYVYTGNVYHPETDCTRCHQCGDMLIERDRYEIGQYAMDGDCCGKCGARVPGLFESQPGSWGRRRQQVNVGAY